MLNARARGLHTHLVESSESTRRVCSFVSLTGAYAPTGTNGVLVGSAWGWVCSRLTHVAQTLSHCRQDQDHNYIRSFGILLCGFRHVFINVGLLCKLCCARRLEKRFLMQRSHPSLAKFRICVKSPRGIQKRISQLAQHVLKCSLGGLLGGIWGQSGPPGRQRVETDGDKLETPSPLGGPFSDRLLMCCDIFSEFC